MASDAAALLDELMGRNRNVAKSENAKEIEWSDEEVIGCYDRISRDYSGWKVSGLFGLLVKTAFAPAPAFCTEPISSSIPTLLFLTRCSRFASTIWLSSAHTTSSPTPRPILVHAAYFTTTSCENSESTQRGLKIPCFVNRGS